MNCLKLAILLLLSAALNGQAQKVSLPHIRQNGEVKQLFVDDKPFVMLAGELHNSSASSIEYMQPIWNRLTALNLNTVIGYRQVGNLSNRRRASLLLPCGCPGQ